ncbi:hypothetical protein [Bythopirellula polymerisocia]|uniref:Uncharacterized protein n=1 Tax=Bythopirellula polymerisocia TaxID=2528003 RepID=A0A5C6CYM8_9BACT|nr:hypothetical protein [Bythopirellula polymerisocia]TWU29498.1 hypothetical protein Pla144_02760 [Bythopirellula polymerisocia]
MHANPSDLPAPANSDYHSIGEILPAVLARYGIDEEPKDSFACLGCLQGADYSVLVTQ